jgi:hypothetical protein
MHSDEAILLTGKEGDSWLLRPSHRIRCRSGGLVVFRSLLVEKLFY